MNETPTRERKVPMSVRLPRTVVERLDDYARLNGMSRTDAIVHYLERGMDGTLQPESAELLRSIDSRLDEACIALGKIVGERQAADRAGGSIGQGITADLVHAISAVCERFPAVRRAYVFGSFARGTAGPESISTFASSFPRALHSTCMTSIISASRSSRRWGATSMRFPPEG